MYTALWATISRYLCFLFYTPRSQVFTPSPRAIPGADINEEFLSITVVYSLLCEYCSDRNGSISHPYALQMGLWRTGGSW